jgi:transcriptional regulator with XRE-family HTH domain
MTRRARSRREGQVSDDAHESGDSKIAKLPTLEERRFGAHVRRLRRCRGLTQERLADRGGLSADTIRRLEHGSFSPSLDTLAKLCVGLSLAISTLFETFELGESNKTRELVDLLATRTPHEVKLVTNLVRALLDQLDGIEPVVDDADEEPPAAIVSDGLDGEV